MSKVIKNSIDHNLIDFGCTALDSQAYPFGKISPDDTIEFYYQTGELAASVKVESVLQFIEVNKLHETDEKEAYELDPTDYLDEQFDAATQAYFMSVLAKPEGEEVSHAA